MKKHNWYIKYTNENDCEDTPLIIDLVTMDKNNSGEVTSLGLARLNDVLVGSVQGISGDFWDKPRKIQIPKKTIKYVLAHNLAKTIYTGGKISLADKHVVGWFGLFDDKSVRDARNKYIKAHYKKIGCEKVRFICFDGDNGVQLSMLCLDGENFKPPINGFFSYTGRFYSWIKDEDNIVAGHGTLSTDM